MKTIGILGGMGPQASIRFYRSIIEQSQKVHGAKRNDEFPHLLLSNLPVPDLITGKEMMDSSVDMICREAKTLEKAGADVLVLVCNTMHLFMGQYERAVTIPFLSIIDETVKKVLEDKRKCVGLLGSRTLIQSGIYRRKLEGNGVRVLEPGNDELAKLSNVIMRIIAGELGEQEMQILQNFIKKFRTDGAEAVVLGCTELPLVLNNQNSLLHVYDSAGILAAKCCREMYGAR